MDRFGAIQLGMGGEPNQPTYMWMPEWHTSMGDEAIEHATDAGMILDEYQALALMCALALTDDGALLLFELCIILSRQNGKGTFIEALELAWLFLFNYKLVMHSAHLFETSKEHFLRMQMLIQMNPQFDHRVKRIYSGRGSEEIVLKDGARLKFMTRKGGAGRGFVGTKNVYDEAMYLDALAMSAGLPALATQRDAQVIYTASAGLDVSTQLAAVRHRAYAPTRRDDFTGQLLPGDPSLGFMEWAITKPVYNEAGELTGGDDPSQRAVVERVNPAMVRRRDLPHLTWDFVQKEARALGGHDSEDFMRERCGVGNYPLDDEQWAVISKAVWFNAVRTGQEILQPITDCRKVLAIAGDPDRGTATLCLAARRPGGRAHLEVIERHRGTAWIAPRVAEVIAGLRKRDLPEAMDDIDEWRLADDGQPVIILRGDVTEHVASLLGEQFIAVQVATAGDYATGCQSLVEQIRTGGAHHLGEQASLNKAVATAEQRTGSEGGWRWALETAQDAGPLRAVTLALLGLDRFAPKSDDVGDVW